VLRRVAAVVLGAGLALGLVTTAVGATTEATTPTAKTPTVSAAECTQLRRRLGGSSATLARVDANLDELRARVGEVRLPVRRAALEQRIQRLEQLRAALAKRIADARAACTNTT
jgi:hypothetical protein